MMTEVDPDRLKLDKTHGDGTDGQAACLDYCKTIENNHGRIETRSVRVCDQVEHLGKAASDWAGLAARRMGDLVREHGSVENNLHWKLDVSFDEDQRRIRKVHGAENFSRLCRPSVNPLKKDKAVQA